MVELKTFRTLGYILAALGLMGSVSYGLKGFAMLMSRGLGRTGDAEIDELVDTINKHTTLKAVGQIVGASLGVALYSAFIVGIRRASVAIVDVVTIIYIICNVLGLLGLSTAAIVFVCFVATNQDDSGALKMYSMVLFVAAIFCLGLLMLQLWILNGVKRYVEWKSGTTHRNIKV